MVVQQRVQDTRGTPTRPFTAAVAVVAVVVPLLYLASDVLEAMQGGHGDLSLLLTYLGEAPTVFVVLGVYAVQRPWITTAGLAGAVLYGYAFIFWAGFTLHGILTRAPDLPALAAEVGSAYWLHAVAQTVGGLLFGWATWRAKVLPRWTAALLMLAMVGHVLLSAVGGSESYRWLPSTLQNVALLAMGVAAWRGVPGQRAASR